MEGSIASVKKDKIWNAQFISVFIANGMMYLGQWMCNALIAKYADHLGASVTAVGFVTSVFAYSAIIIKFVSAPAIDTFNKKYIAFFSMAGMAIAFWGYGFSHSIPILIAFRLLQGCCQGFTATCCLALATDTLPPSKIGSGIGYFSLAQAMCQAVGPTLGLNLMTAFGYKTAFITAGVCTFTGALCTLRIHNNFVKTRKFRISLQSMIAKEALIPAAILFCFTIAYSNINSFLVLYGESEGMDTTKIGLFFTVYAVTLLFSRPLIGKLTDRFGFVKVLIPATACFAFSFLLISFSNRIWMFLLAAFINAFGYGASQPAVQALCMKLVPVERRGAGSCTSYFGSDGGNLVGPLIAGTVIECFGYKAMWRTMLIPILLAMLIVIIFRGVISGTKNKM